MDCTKDHQQSDIQDWRRCRRKSGGHTRPRDQALWRKEGICVLIISTDTPKEIHGLYGIACLSIFFIIVFPMLASTYHDASVALLRDVLYILTISDVWWVDNMSGVDQYVFIQSLTTHFIFEISQCIKVETMCTI